MENELINIFDEQRKKAGIATRAEVHKRGHWHETFHCWVISRQNGIDYIDLQIRSHLKKDFPNLLDITAAGHLLAHETVHEGIREVNEELGIRVSFNELLSLGVIKDRILTGDFIDNEFCHVYLYKSKYQLADYRLQQEEVSGIVRAKFDEFFELWTGARAELEAEGFEINDAGEKVSIHMRLDNSKFVPHEKPYYQAIVKLIRNQIGK
ncbi:NUDIX domain-containing protein [Bacillus sp. CECT 9360]|uniref:NUDIX hydrolase n=1 Tax=Bacillus sp. CECT 9360 TaxID=2845821 RepID=UPI001E40E822|nr:NUDIX domain-containing protein [Bacillus sp. CECT 9360]CAH0347234.1 Isopentenyl-diphosphate Delta-isomerase [Bacillus sp. CECT 9360]